MFGEAAPAARPAFGFGAPTPPAGVATHDAFAGAPICDRGHTMVVSDYAEGAYRSGYVCNACSKASSAGHLGGSRRRWFCRECSDDYCFACHPEPASIFFPDGRWSRGAHLQ